MRALVTDAHYKNGLCAIRSLGARGAWVLAAAPRRLASGFASRFTAARATYPPPEHEDAFMTFLEDAVRRHAIDVVLPLSQAAVEAVARNRAAIDPHAAVALADWSTIELAGDKRRAIEFARDIGVPVPRAFETPAHVDRFPVVVKDVHGSGGVRYASDPAELSEAFTPEATIQEYVPGEGFGFFALFSHGAEQAVFMHRRIREFPVTGGASTAAESFRDARLEEHGLRLLRALGWHGPAMAEFKRDERDGEYKLIEINPKFWGSLDLSVAAGVDFPFLTAQVALGEPVESEGGYEDGLRFQWVYDDLLHAIARPGAAGAVARDLVARSVRHDLRRDDLKPALVDAARFAGALTRRVATGTLRRPHGAVRDV